MSAKHAVVLGATGMLRAVTLGLVERGSRVTAVATTSAGTSSTCRVIFAAASLWTMCGVPLILEMWAISSRSEAPRAVKLMRFDLASGPSFHHSTELPGAVRMASGIFGYFRRLRAFAFLLERIQT